MQLDADLGIDSIKRVEILSAVQERLPGLPTLKPEQLGSFRTLRAIVDFIGQSPRDGRDAAAGPSAEDFCPAPAAMSLRCCSRSSRTKRVIPAEMLELDMRLDTDLGIDSIKRVEIFSAVHDRLPEAPAAGPNSSGPWEHSGRSSPS